jgi:hypothetical protein
LARFSPVRTFACHLAIIDVFLMAQCMEYISALRCPFEAWYNEKVERQIYE